MENKRKLEDKKKQTFGDRSVCAGMALKTRPMFALNTTSYIPCNWTCCDCMPISCGGFVNDDLKDSKCINILDLPYSSYTGVRSIFCDVFFVLSRNINYSYNNIHNNVLQHPRINEAISLASLTSAEEEPSNQTTLTKKTADFVIRLQDKSRQILSNMAASFKVTILKLTGWVLYKLLRHVLSSLTVHNGQLYTLKQICKRDVPVLLLPTHKSHLDYIILSFILFNYHIKLPYVAAGDNLKLPIFQDLMKSYGGFFVRRSMDTCNNKDHIYRAVLKTYMEEMMKEAEMLEFFIEGGRARGGKILNARTGLLAYVVDAYFKGLVTDIMVVPVSISYEKLIEGDFIYEQLGQEKARESFIGVLFDTLKALNRNHGAVRVDFAQAFSIKEFFSNPEMSSRSCGSLPTSNTRLENTSFEELKSDRDMVDKLAQHISYDQFRNISVSATNIISWLLLYKTDRNKPISISKLGTWFECHKDEVLYKGHFLNFQAPFQNLLEHSVRMLKPHVEYNKKSQCVVVRDNLESLIYLCYHANTLNMIYALDAVVAMGMLKCYSRDYKRKMAEGMRRQRCRSEEEEKERMKDMIERKLLSNGGITNDKDAKAVMNGRISDNVILCDSLKFTTKGLDYSDIVGNRVKEKINSGTVIEKNSNGDVILEVEDGVDDTNAGKESVRDTNSNKNKPEVINEKVDDMGDENYEDDDDEDFNIIFYKKDVLQAAAGLFACLKYEFILSPPCKRLHHTLTEAFYRVADAHNIVNQQELVYENDDDIRGNKKPANTMYLDMPGEECDEADLVYVTRRASLRGLRQQTLLLQPILQTYTIVTSHLTCLLISDLPEKEFVSKAQVDLKNRYKNKQLMFGESVCFETVLNCVKLLVHNEVLGTYMSSKEVKMLKLNEDYNDAGNLHNLISHFSSFSPFI